MTPTRAQKLALDAIQTLTDAGGGVPPSYSEIGNVLGMRSRSQVHSLLHRMRDLGLVQFEDDRRRTVRVTSDVERLSRRPTADLLQMRTQIEAILIDRSEA